MSDVEQTLVPCFVCGKTLEAIGIDYPMQPYGGVICSTRGNYGSRIYDPPLAALDKELRLVFLVCDECLTQHGDRVRYAKTTHVRPETTYTEWPAA